ncbi:hypothetical protein ACFX11_031410 [Malus domestica]
MWTSEFPSWHGSNLKPKAPNASSETEEPQPGGPNPSPERVEQHPKNSGPPPRENTNSNLRMQENLPNHLIRERDQQIEALTNENRKLTSKSEVAHAKLEIIVYNSIQRFKRTKTKEKDNLGFFGFEKGTQEFSEVMAKTKDVILVSTLSKSTETFMNFSSQAACDALSPQDSAQDRKSASKDKRKKLSWWFKR